MAVFTSAKSAHYVNILEQGRKEHLACATARLLGMLVGPGTNLGILGWDAKLYQANLGTYGIGLISCHQ